MAKQLMPRAELEARDSDLHLTDEQFLNLSLFAQLKRKPSLDKFPGAMVVRHYRKGEVICRQGEAGWTAFYILTSADVLKLREAQLQALPPAPARDGERKALEYEIAVLRQRVEHLAKAPADDEKRVAATVFLAVARGKPSPRGSGTGLLRALGLGPTPGQPTRNVEDKTLYIPIDGPVTLNYDTLRAPLQEGELFGEMSCMYRSPRSGTIVARRDCYMVEMLRNILDGVQKDPVYKARSDEVYKKRVLDLQLRKLSLFSDLKDDEFALIRDSVELVNVEPGTLICDEHERSDSLYIVRSGLVKVMKNVSSLLHRDDVLDWKALCAGLRQGEANGATPLGKLWQQLPPRVQEIVKGAGDPPRLNGPDQAEVVYALNDVLKMAQLLDVKELQGVKDAPTAEQTAELAALRVKLKNPKDRDDADVRRFNRLLLLALLPQAVAPPPRQGGPECILNYCSRGDFFGEIGLMLSQPRSATCVAYGHPNDYGQVELVRVPGRAFWQLMKTSATLKEKVKAEAGKRRQHTLQRLLTPVWDDGATEVQVSPHFEELGLIQGQKLMLIDLDRCTRCDECVKACVNTHEDGRSRLYLDGPRFGKYLVPTTCRSCLDPVCMIGCPVGSIHRGDNREIVIEDWCIGCSLCADNCPYGSIQMHDLGIVPERARGWRYQPAAAVKGEKWLRPDFNDGGWKVGDGPFYLDRELKDQVASVRVSSPAPAGAPADAINFRFEFQVSKQQLRESKEFKVEVVSMAPSVRVWLNGQELTADDKPKRGRREYTLPQPLTVDGAATETKVQLRAGTNALAVQVTPTAKADEVLMQARLDAVRRPDLPEDVDERVAEEITEKLVTQHAVVCDLCSNQYGRVPACVNACPHDAALRVNARFEFPVR